MVPLKSGKVVTSLASEILSSSNLGKWMNAWWWTVWMGFPLISNFRSLAHFWRIEGGIVVSLLLEMNRFSKASSSVMANGRSVKELDDISNVASCGRSLKASIDRWLRWLSFSFKVNSFDKPLNALFEMLVKRFLSRCICWRFELCIAHQNFPPTNKAL